MNNSHDNNLLYTFLDHYEKQLMPLLLSIQQKVSNKTRLNDYEISFLEGIYSEIQTIQPLVERHPEYQTLFSRFVDLYKDISLKALENEKTQG